jgi:Nif-specific regulatory protein
LLEERRQDIPLLASRFCKATHETMGLPLFELSAGALLAVEHADWPGNVRELAHTVAAGVIRALGEGATRVERRHLFPAPAGRANESSLTFQDATRKFSAVFCPRP